MSKTKKEVEAENRLLRSARLSFGITAFLGTLVRWGGAVLITRYGYLGAAVLAGQTTGADIGVSLLGDFRINSALAWALAGCGGGYGAYQRKLRKDTVARLSDRVRILETQIDPKRTSSDLTPRGDNPEDQP